MDRILAYDDWSDRTPREYLIKGEIVRMSPPEPMLPHTISSGNLFALFKNYLQGKTCMVMPDRTYLRLSKISNEALDKYLDENHRFKKKVENIVPDMMVVCNREYIKMSGVCGPPDLVAEILSVSTEREDRYFKKRIYELLGVKEYWLVNYKSKTVEVSLLKDGKYQDSLIYHTYSEYEKSMMYSYELAEILEDIPVSLFPGLIIKPEAIFENTDLPD